MKKIALFLAGGGARGAYQAGVLKALSKILQVQQAPFETITGVSVGSLNAAVLAEYAHDFPSAVTKLEILWQEINTQKIYHASNFELGKSVLRNLSYIFSKQRQSGFLLNTSPLRQFISANTDFDAIAHNIRAGYLKTLEIISRCYETQQTISFYQHHDPEFEDWHYERHISQRTLINLDHIMSSSALPIFFPSVKINDLHYGDGSLGLVFPLRGAIRFRVDKILIIGTRPLHLLIQPKKANHGEIGFAQILGCMLDALFLDNLERDIEMVNRMNDIANMVSMWNKRHSPWRPIQTNHLRPSIDIATIAQNQYETMPVLLRFLLNILGAKSHSGDLLSFLLFEKRFSSELIQLGYDDTMHQEAEIKRFFDV